jgi:hypothetical protein
MTRAFFGALCAAGIFLVVPPAAAQTQAETTQTQTQAQEPAQEQDPAATSDRLRVFLDCFECFQSYLREEIDWVDFVRQVQDADVSLLTVGRQTGGGGRAVTLRFIGRGVFEDHDHELLVVTQNGDTENTRRAAILETVVVGLLDYVAHTGLPDFVDVSVRSQAAQAAVEEPVEDPWNLWVFSVRAGGEFEEEESRSTKGWNVNLTADRVTDAWRIGFGGRVNRETQTFDLDDNETLEVNRNSGNMDWFLGKSLSDHWTAAIEGRMESSSFGNTKLSVNSGPAIEYNLFPWSEYATRQLRFKYKVGAEYVEYDEITIFFETEETLWRQEFEIDLDQRQPWGTMRAGFEFGQFLHDTSKYKIDVNGNVNIRITRGLSVNANANASRIRDQLSLPLGGATQEEVLLRVRELQSGFEVRFSFGITYSFGSLFNNIVNPRFGKGSGFGNFGGFSGRGGGGGGRR